MFRNLGFLVLEIWLLIALAALVGLIAGWLIWSRRPTPEPSSETIQLRADLERAQALRANKEDHIRALEAEIKALRAAQKAAPHPPEMATKQIAGIKPATLAAPRDGKPDNLKKIKGIGPKLERICQEIGVYHYDQIASWSAEEVAWVDANLEGFHGRVSRDGWVEQAKTLASGGSTAFSKKVEGGSVY